MLYVPLRSKINDEMTLSTQMKKEINVSQKEEEYCYYSWDDINYNSKLGVYTKEGSPFTGKTIDDHYQSMKTIFYFKNGAKHRENGPAVIIFYVYT